MIDFKLAELDEGEQQRLDAAEPVGAGPGAAAPVRRCRTPRLQSGGRARLVPGLVTRETDKTAALPAVREAAAGMAARGGCRLLGNAAGFVSWL
ncbi:hypothetical protein GCM10010389_32280 [Streptomyces echinoruber]|uniref:Uncharacterized protein n=1 Tax=Streptomyces echinoruber TaxID=68898 RepID=A0A918RBK1_9ACTN|nr:hypothetical protein GCM10010389_32280 [Streptomyces echinoruber]